MSSFKQRIMDEFGEVPKLTQGHTYMKAYSQLTNPNPIVRAQASVTYSLPSAFPSEYCDDIPRYVLIELLKNCIDKYNINSSVVELIDMILDCNIGDIPREIIYYLGATENIDLLFTMYNYYQDERSHDVWSDAIIGAVRANKPKVLTTIIRNVAGGIYDYDASEHLVEGAAIEAARLKDKKILSWLVKNYSDEMDFIFERMAVDPNDKIESLISKINT